MTALYAKRCAAYLEPHYSAHVSAMTSEGLHAKSDIAAELAARDKELCSLRTLLEDAIAFLEMDDCEVGDDVWVWLHHARDKLDNALAKPGASP